jgi:hypothetical protein
MNTNVDEILNHLWDEIQMPEKNPEEPNLRDFKLIAETLRFNYVNKMPQKLPSCNIGLKIVEYIEDNIFKDTQTYQIHHVVRNLTLENFSERMKKTAKKLQVKRYLNGGTAEVLCIAFYIWFGCISMAKLTRFEGSDRVPYTSEIKLEGYSWLKSEWKNAEKQGNYWIKYGVELAKQLEEKRKEKDPNKIIVDDWIPQNSPYWKNISKT